MKILILLSCLLSTSSFAYNAIRCSSENYETLRAAHSTAKEYIEQAHEMIQKNDPLVAEGLKRYFNLDALRYQDRKQHRLVMKMMYRLWKNVNRVKYRCAKDSGLYCSPGTLALVPPFSRIQVCPSYFNRSPQKQVATLIHEWGHRWGFFRLKYIFEKYCTETEGAPASVLVKQPDSYMLFTYYLATQGRGIDCFKKETF